MMHPFDQKRFAVQQTTKHWGKKYIAAGLTDSYLGEARHRSGHDVRQSTSATVTTHLFNLTNLQ